MLDQSYNLNCCFLIASLFQIYIYSKKLFFFMFSKTLMLLLIDKVTTGTYFLAQFIWNVALAAHVASLVGLGRSTATAAVIDILDIMQCLDHDKSSSISQLIISKPRDLQKLLKYFNGTTTSVYNVSLSACVLSIIFVLYTKYLLVLLCYYLFHNHQH